MTELRNAELLTVPLGLQWSRWSIIHHAKHIIGLHSVVHSYYVQFEHFEWWQTMWGNKYIILNTLILPWFMLLFHSKALLQQWKPRDATENFDTYQNLQPHRAVLPVIAWHLVKKVLTTTPMLFRWLFGLFYTRYRSTTSTTIEVAKCAPPSVSIGSQFDYASMLITQLPERMPHCDTGTAQWVWVTWRQFSQNWPMPNLLSLMINAIVSKLQTIQAKKS